MSAKQVQKINKPLAVLISDVHYSMSTLDLADTAFRAAIDEAARLKIPLIDCGDLTNDKAILRAEVVNTLINTMKYAEDRGVKVHLLVGNHSLINEKGKEHALNFLAPYADIVSQHTTIFINKTKIGMIPYQSSSEAFKNAVLEIEKTDVDCDIIITHQGFKGAFMGDYFQDKTSVEPEFMEGYIVYSGHYHKHQTIGPILYVGNPYTLSFGEANDGPKGYLVIGSDGSYKHVALKLRRHYFIDMHADYVVDLLHNNSPSEALSYIPPYSPVKLRISGVTKPQLKVLKKAAIGAKFFGHTDFGLELVEVISQSNDSSSGIPVQFQGAEGNTKLFDMLIDQLPGNDEDKTHLKAMWRKMMA